MWKRPGKGGDTGRQDYCCAMGHPWSQVEVAKNSVFPGSKNHGDVGGSSQFLQTNEIIPFCQMAEEGRAVGRFFLSVMGDPREGRRPWGRAFPDLRGSFFDPIGRLEGDVGGDWPPRLPRVSAR